jgi:hypothetical protein
MFELPTPTLATLNTVTNRSELHGDDKAPAISLDFTVEAANTILDRLSDTLRGALYTRPDGQSALPGVEDTTPLLRALCMESIAVAGSFEGWTLNVDHGIDEGEPITFGGVKVDKFRVSPKQGGTVELHFRCGTSDIDAESLGLIGMKLGQDLSITLLAPKVAGEPKAKDGGGELFKDEAKPAAKKARKGDADPSGQTGGWPFPGDNAPLTPDGALAAALEKEGAAEKGAKGKRGAAALQ